MARRLCYGLNAERTDFVVVNNKLVHLQIWAYLLQLFIILIALCSASDLTWAAAALYNRNCVPLVFTSADHAHSSLGLPECARPVFTLLLPRRLSITVCDTGEVLEV